MKNKFLLIDYSKLTRNYITQPIQKINNRNYEDVNKNDLKYLYNDLNLSLKDLKEYFNKSIKYILRQIKKYNLTKPPYKNASDKIIDAKLYDVYKIDNTKLTRDYILNPLIKGNDEYPVKEDLIYLYLDRNISIPLLSKYFNRDKKIIQKWLMYYNIKKNYDKIMDSKIMCYRLHNSFSKSKPEESIYRILISRFPETRRQYKSDLYPFNCDFYIPEIDTYVEYQGNWTHGNEPFISTPKQLEILEYWKSKNTPYYNTAILDWTERDVLKRETAKKNKLNWIEFFNMKQFNEWFERL